MRKITVRYNHAGARSRTFPHGSGEACWRWSVLGEGREAQLAGAHAVDRRRSDLSGRRPGQGYPSIRRQQPRQYASASRYLLPLHSFLGLGVIPVPTPSHPRARASSRIRSAAGGRGGTGFEVREVRGGGRGTAQASHAADRRPSDANRVKAAQFGDQLRVDLAERAADR
ncbi:hypothetical protein EVAR_64426_1 [Eumeta japonica]|uniref:Uncharacterized protein n=1 Tax=Eumeta variegata TaxID=151549 RepID=A0A4C1ZGA2_EUMVA|nr:hypothetical protein EVAR_64426_1 [Eumeta japonica]